jgi:hypothetical protein
MLKCIIFVLLISCATSHGKSIDVTGLNEAKFNEEIVAKDAIQDILNQLLQEAINQGIGALIGALGN